jgi:hydrogenase maturation protease
MSNLLVLGLGNVLCTDDGVGVAAVTRLQRRYHPPPEALVLDGGTLGLSLLPLLRDAKDVILLDAVNASLPAGSLVRIEGDDVGPAVEQRLSPHQVGVADLLDGARLLDGDVQRIVLLGVVPDHIQLGAELTQPVRAAVDDLVEAAIAQARRWGVRFELRGDDDEDIRRADHHAARVLGL